MNLVEAFDQSVANHPEKTAVYWGENEVSYGQIASATNGIARQLTQRFGVQPGDRVGIWMKNRPEFIHALYGILRAGAVAVPINNFLKPEEVTYILGNAEARALISESGMEAAFGTLKSGVEGLAIIDLDAAGEEGQVDSGEESPVSPRQESDLAVIIYTSGTTGRPKGAMLSHGNLLHNVNSCRIVLEAVEADRFVLLLPMFHSFMLCVCIVLPLTVGGSILLVRSLHPPKNIIQEIVVRQATILPAIPQLFRALAANPPDIELPLRMCVSGAAPLPGEILKEFTERLKIPLLEGYGLSEASPVVAMTPIPGPWKAGSIGVPVHDVEVRFINDAGEPLPAGEAGELCVRGGNVMQGYWRNDEATAEALKDGWLLTGDIGYRDDDGYLYITDRKKDMLLVNGINVYPREIEEVIYQFSGVKEAAVVGKKDSRKGEQPIAFVVMNEGAEADGKAILAYVRQHLADYKKPREVIFLEALPRNATGKVLKTELRKHPSVKD